MPNTSLLAPTLIATALAVLTTGCPASTTSTEGDAGMDTGPSADDTGVGTDGAPEVDTGAPLDSGAADDTGVVSDASGSDAGVADWHVCAVASDCVLAPNDCCGWCGTGHLTDVDAVNATYTAEHSTEVCPHPETTPCPACAGGPLDPQVVAVCESAACTALDLGAMDITACTAPPDCEVQYANCCACAGTDDEVVAVRTDAGRSALDALFCAGGFCALDCATRTPSGWTASCDAGHCRPVAP